MKEKGREVAFEKREQKTEDKRKENKGAIQKKKLTLTKSRDYKK